MGGAGNRGVAHAHEDELSVDCAMPSASPPFPLVLAAGRAPPAARFSPFPGHVLNQQAGSGGTRPEASAGAHRERRRGWGRAGGRRRRRPGMEVWQSFRRDTILEDVLRWRVFLHEWQEL
jgi:hypothetical protein